MKKKLVLCALVLCVLATLLALPAMAEETKCTHTTNESLWKDTGVTFTVRKYCHEIGTTFKEQQCEECLAKRNMEAGEDFGRQHKWDKEDYNVIEKPTCQTQGLKRRTCVECGWVEEDVVKDQKEPHDFIIEGIVALPCTNNDLVKTCKWCGLSEIEDQPEEPHVYSDDDWTVTKEPTCSEDGEEVRFCRVCKEKKETRSIDRLEHVMKYEWEYGVVPNCLEKGYKIHYCTVCGYYTRQEVAAVGYHTPGEKVTRKVEPNCGTNGAEYSICEVCREEVVKNVLYSEGAHEVEYKILKPVTCLEDGIKQAYCVLCNQTIGAEEKITKLGHDYSKYEVTAATCEADGYTTYYCQREGCGYSTKVVDEGSKLPHNYRVIEVVKVNCQHDGYTEVECKDCGLKAKINVIKKIKCDSEVLLLPKAATCTEDGWTRGKSCSMCGKMTVGEKIEKLGHKAGAKVVATAPTCTEKGSETVSCVVCKAVMETTEIPALGHKAGEKVVIAPTCTKKGAEIVRCTVCDEILENNTLKAEGHMFSKDRICIKCGYNVTTDKMPSKPCDPVAEGAVVNAEGKAVKYTTAKKNGVQTLTVTSAKTGIYTLKLDKDALDAIKKAGTKEITLVVGDVTLSIPVAALKDLNLGKGEIQFQVNGNKFAAQTLVNGVIADQTEAMTKAGVVVK